MSTMKVLLIEKMMKLNFHKHYEGPFECISGAGIMHSPGFKSRRNFYQLRRFNSNSA